MLFALLIQAAPAPQAVPTDDAALMTWGVILLASAAAMLVAELFLPSGGLISVAAAIAAVGGLICLFFHDTTLGALATLAVLIATPFIAGFMLKLWPHSPVGHWLILGGGDDEPDADPPMPKAPAVRVGDTGSTKTPLRPVGTCVINGRRTECLAEAGMIDAGTAVRVVDVDGKEIRVRAV